MESLTRWFREKPQWLMIVVGAGAVLLMGLIFVARQLRERDVEEPLIQVMSETSQTEISSELLPTYADIKGAVVRPGMYQIPQNARVLDLVRMAGGFTAEAAQNQVNFSQMVEDQMVIYVPTSAEDFSEWQEGQLGIRTEGPATTSAKVNLNKADSSELQQLNGIGEKKAAAIIDYRQENGSFNSVEELKKVSGIGDKIFDNLKDEIEV